MKIRKFLASVLTFCMLLGLLLVPAQSVHAANQAVMDARNGIIEVMQVVTVDGEVFLGSRGTGFLVGNDEGSQTVITNHHVVNEFPYDDKQLSAYIKDYCDEMEIREPDDDAKLTVEIRIAVKRDVYITAEIVNQSEAGDFAILKMEQPIYDRTPLQLADSSQVTSTQKVYALGFPAAVEFQADVVHTADDVTVTDGIISKVTEGTGTEAPVSTIFHSAPISEGNSGGPLVNEEGHVIGINTYGVSTTATSYYYSTEINEVTDVLTALGIEYTSAGASTTPETTDTPETTETTTPEPTPETTPEPVEDNSELFDSLNTLIKEAENLETDGMTAESVKVLDDAIDEAKDVYNNTASTEAEIEDAKAELKKAMDSLEEEGMSVGVIVGVAAALIVVIVVVAVVIVNNNNKKKQKRKAEVHRPVPPTPQPAPRPMTPPTPQPAPRPMVMPMGSDGSEETGVLNDGSSETTVLSGQNIPTAYLIRRKNNERITISKAVFKIGKERRKVDFCISDNTNISRTHADIVYRNGEFYIVDNNATNGTSVNGSSVASGQDRKLSNNDMIKLADEEFQFRTF